MNISVIVSSTLVITTGFLSCSIRSLLSSSSVYTWFRPHACMVLRCVYWLSESVATINQRSEGCGFEAY